MLLYYIIIIGNICRDALLDGHEKTRDLYNFYRRCGCIPTKCWGMVDRVFLI